MAVLKHTSPTASPTAPQPTPCRIVPSARARTPVTPGRRSWDILLSAPERNRARNWAVIFAKRRTRGNPRPGPARRAVVFQESGRALGPPAPPHPPGPRGGGGGGDPP